MSPTTTVKVWYEISAKRDKVFPDFRHEVGERLYLGRSTDGYPSVETDRFDRPYRWSKIPADLPSWSGRPWYNTFDPASLEIFKVTERTSTTRVRA